MVRCEELETDLSGVPFKSSKSSSGREQADHEDYEALCAVEVRHGTRTVE